MNITLKQPVKSPAVITNAFGDTHIDYSRFGLKGHNGVDYAGNLGDPVLAAADGRVEKIAYDPNGYGNYIVLRHEGATTLYAHLKRDMVRIGDRVRAGDQIGEMGYSGNVVPRGPEGTHLHFGLRPALCNEKDGYGGYVDPIEYIRWSAEEIAQEEAANGISGPDNGNGSSNYGNRGFDNDTIPSIPGYLKIVSSVAPNARRTPGGEVLFQVKEGAEVLATGRTHAAAGLLWRELLFPIWIAERDWDGTPILEQQ